MAWTLYRYILIELIKVLTITAVVLVALISFAAAVRPISDGLLSPGALARFLLYTAPTMLGFALPFAGAFASTIVLLRMAQDNEVVACSASGLSYRQVLAPVIGLGLALTLGLFILSNTVIPGFFRAAQQIVKRDIVSLMVARLDHGRPFDSIPGYTLYADEAREVGLDEAPELARFGAERAVLLEGVAVAELGRNRRILRDYTASSATVLVLRQEQTDDVYAEVRLRDAVLYDPERNDFGYSEQLSFEPFLTPDPLSDEPKFFSSTQLAALSDEPQRFDRVRKAMRELTLALATERLRLAITSRLDDVTLRGPIKADRFRVRSAPPVPLGDELVLNGRDGGPVVVERFLQLIETGDADRIYEAAEARLSVKVSPWTGEPTIELVLLEVTAHPTGVRQAELRFPELRWPDPIFEQERQTLSYDALAELATSPVYAASQAVRAKRGTLYGEYVSLHHRIAGTQHERAASAIATGLLLLLGAVTAIRLRFSLPLVAYFLTFVLAVLSVIIVNAGGNMATTSTFPLAASLGMMWSGNVLLLLVLGYVYTRVAKH